MKRLLLLAMVAAPALCAGATETAGHLASKSLIEVSGIAASSRDPGLFWAINDGGSAPDLHAFSLDGAELGSIRVGGVGNIDWEDLAAFVVDDTAYLLIADTGDNLSRRPTSWIYVVAEPVADHTGRFGGRIEPLVRLPFRYEDGPRDCEAVAVDVASDRILLVSRRDFPAAVYELPLQLAASPRRPLIARRIGTIDTLPRPTVAEMLSAPLLGPWRHQPTALDIAPDGRRAAVLTYQNLYLFERPASQDWSDTFSVAASVVIALPMLAQFESAALAGEYVVVLAEGLAVPIFRLGPVGAPPL